MAQLKSHANIMLDLECVCVGVNNPALIELGAVHFDLSTGAEIRTLKTPISLQSCLSHGLLCDSDTTSWVSEHIPETLATSKITTITLENALFKLSNFVRNAVLATKKTLRESGKDPELCQPKIWGNGVIADNVWIKSAYLACKMERPWKFTGDMCVRTFVQMASMITGRNYTKEVKREGRHHDALDDCRHQVKYLVLAVNSLALKEEKSGADTGLSTPISTKSPLNIPWSQTPSGDIRTMFEIKPLEPATTETPSKTSKKILRPGPDTATLNIYDYLPNLSLEEELDEFDSDLKNLEIHSDEEFKVFTAPSSDESPNVPQNRRRIPPSNAAILRPGMLPTPNTSFSSAKGELEDIPGLVSKRAAQD